MFETYYSILFLIIIIPLSLLLSYLHYKSIELTKPRKYTLTALRFFSFALVLILILFPVIKFVEYYQKQNKDIILIDNSLSLKIENRDSILKKKVKDFIEILESEGRNYDIYLFSGSLMKKILKDEVEYINYDSVNNFKTNLSAALEVLLQQEKDNKITTVNIFSDGIINDGNDIVSSAGLNVKVNFFLIGEKEQKTDLVIKELLFNKYSFIEAEVPIVVKFSSYKVNGNIKINLFEEDKLINYSYQQISPDKTDYELTFKVKSNVESIKRYKIEIEPESSEITHKNNYRNFFIKFISNKFKVLVVAGNPSPDLSFLKNQVTKISNIEAEYFTQKDGTNFYEGTITDIKNYSCIMFYGFPTAESGNALLERLKKDLEKFRIPIFFFASRKVDYNKLKYFENSLPFKVVNTDAYELDVKLKVVSGLKENPYLYSAFYFEGIENFPTLFYKPNLVTVKPDAFVFISLANETSPVFFIEASEFRKSAAFCAYGLNNWRLNPSDYNYEPVFNSILVNTISTLYEYEKSKRIIVIPMKDEFSPFEDIIIYAKLNPIYSEEKSKVSMIVQDQDEEFFPLLNQIAEHNYEAKFKIARKGDYITEASLENINIPEAKDKFRFFVNENNFEYIETKSTEDYLQRISNFTGGKNLTSLSDKEIKEYFNEEIKQEFSFDYIKNIYLNYNPFYIIIVIILFSLEWFLRKKFNLP